MAPLKDGLGDNLGDNPNKMQNRERSRLDETADRDEGLAAGKPLIIKVVKLV